MIGFLTFLLNIVPFALYLVCAGFLFRRLQKANVGRCWDCQHNETCYKEHTGAALVGGLLWPGTLPFTVGTLLGERDRSAKVAAKQTKVLKMQQEELAAAKHDAAMAKYKRMEAEELTRELRVHGKEI